MDVREQVRAYYLSGRLADAVLEVLASARVDVDELGVRDLSARMIHVGMNVPDKRSLFAEVHRVLSRDAVFVLYEQVRRGPGRLAHPRPWAVDERSSLVETTDDCVAALAAAGFTQVEVEHRTGPVPGAAPPNQQVGPGDILGPAYVEGVTNHIAATRAGLLGGVLVVARA